MSTDLKVDIGIRDRFVPSREVKRRGIRAFDDKLESGPIFIVSNDEPKYVLMTEQFYQELLEEADEASMNRVRQSIGDAAAGRTRSTSVEELIKSFDREEQKDSD